MRRRPGDWPFFSEEIRVIAHRGHSGRSPENTRRAFRAALDAGAQVLETDVHLSADEKIVIWHDEDFSAATGDTRPIVEREWADMRDISLGGEEGEDPADYRPLRLDYALKDFPGVRFNIDMKTRDRRLVEALARALRRAGAANRVVVASFHDHMVRYFRRLMPGIPTCFTKGEVLGLLLLIRTGLAGLARRFPGAVLQVPEQYGRIRVLDERVLKVLRRKGLPVQVWTVNEKEDMRRLLGAGASGIITDHPDRLVEVLREERHET